jgi:hypothetical protein
MSSVTKLMKSCQHPEPPWNDDFFSFYFFLHSCPIIIVITIIIILSLDSTNEWKHVIFGFWGLAYLAQHDSIQFHPFSCKWLNFFSLYGWVMLHSICICNVFFFHSLVVRHLSWLHSLAIENRATWNISVQVIYWSILLQVHNQEEYARP